MTDDGRRLYVADTSRNCVRSFDLDENGGIAGGEVFVEVVHEGTKGRPDGMKLDERGNLYVAANTQEGILGVQPGGEAARAYPPAGDGREFGLGRRGLADAVRHGDELGISTFHEGRGPAVLASGLMGYIPFDVVMDEQQVRPASLGSLDSDGCGGSQLPLFAPVRGRAGQGTSVGAKARNLRQLTLVA